MVDAIVFGALGLGLWFFVAFQFARILGAVLADPDDVLDEGVGADLRAAGQAAVGNPPSAAALSSSTPTHVLGADTPRVPSLNPDPGPPSPGRGSLPKED
jgi:hypothetical protein